MRQLRMVVWLALATVALSGCFRYQSRIVVNTDGSGIVREILVIDRTMLASGAGGQPAGDSLLPRAAELSLPPWVAVRDYAAGERPPAVYATLSLAHLRGWRMRI